LLNASTCQSTELVGQNFGFDIGKLRNAYMRHRLYLPVCVDAWRWFAPMFDLMRQIRYFSTEYHNEPFVSLEVIARILVCHNRSKSLKGRTAHGFTKKGAIRKS
jgi:hypothetical protein